MGKAQGFLLIVVFAGASTPAPGAEERSPLWVKSFRGDGHTTAGARALAIDPAGGVVVAGYSGVDDDPDLVVVKYGAGGELEWTHSHEGPGGARDSAAAIALDGDGNIVVAGTTEVSNREGEIVVLELSPSGDERCTSSSRAMCRRASPRATSTAAGEGC